MNSRILFFTLVFATAFMGHTRLLAQASHWSKPLNFGLLPMMSSAGRYDDVYFTSRDTGVLVSSYGMIFKTYDGAEHWSLKKAVAPNAYFRCVEFSADGQVGIAGTLTGLVFRSTDRGETWEDITANVPDTGKNARRICGLAHHGNIFYGVGWWGSAIARFYKSTDNGLTWTVKLIDTSLATGLVDVVFLTENKGFASGFYASESGAQESAVLRTLDGGNTWEKVFADNTIGGGVWKLQFLDGSFGVGSIQPLFKDTVAMIKTTDGGDTWQLIHAGHVDAWPSRWGTQGIGFLNHNKGWIGGYYNGMLETNDGGLTWSALTENEECNRFFLVDSTMYVSANTVYRYGTERAAGISQAAAPVFLHTLHPVTPNPGRGRITIKFDIKEHQTNTVLKVVDIAGRMTYPVMSGYLKPGSYTYEWDGSKAPAGNYLVWLGTDDVPMIERFTLTD